MPYFLYIIFSRTSIRALFVLLPIFGLTWLFGIFGFSADAVAAMYIFVIMNSSQGLLIFIFHCALNQEVRITHEITSLNVNLRLYSEFDDVLQPRDTITVLKQNHFESKNKSSQNKDYDFKRVQRAWNVSLSLR